MRSILIILAMFGMLLLKTGTGSAENFTECLTRCSGDMPAATANCPPTGEEGHAQCMQESQETLKRCIDSCPKNAPADAPQDTPAEAPKNMPTDTPKEN